MPKPVYRKFIQVDKHQLWCVKWQKNGQPLVLLHGGLSHTQKWERQMLPAVYKTHEVFAYDRTAHGRTKVRKGYFHFDFQVNELINYLETVVKKPAHIIGWSDGGNIGLLTALKRPDLVKSLIGIGMNYTWDAGLSFELDNIMESSQEEKESFAKLSKQDPELLPEIIKKAYQVWMSEPNIKLSKLKKIKCPVLVLAGDDEPFTSRMTWQMYEAIPNGRLAVIPGASHNLVNEKTKLMQEIIKDFYKSLDFPITKMPNRRAKQQAKILRNS
jgi:pimeloyl-ACP methyl ester carboxylesterase